MIRHHHEPDCAPEKFRKITGLIYLSDLITHWQNGEVDFYQFDKDVLSFFHITQEEQLKIISEKLDAAFTE